METVQTPGSYWTRELFTIPGKGYCAVVSNPSECSDFAHLKGFAYINGVGCFIEAVEVMGVPPYKKGQKITLLYRLWESVGKRSTSVTGAGGARSAS